jgi:hypothetical protein
MSIRYASGTYTTPLDLLNALDTYLVSTLGWTRNMTPTLIAGKTAGYRAHYQKTIAKNSESTVVYLNLASAGSTSENIYTTPAWLSAANQIGVHCYCSTGYNSSNAWDQQPGIATILSTLVGAIAFIQLQSTGSALPYNFHGDAYGDWYISVTAQSSVYRNQYLTCGIIDKSGHGVWTGGTYYGGSINVCQAATVLSYSYVGLASNYEMIPGAISFGSVCPSLMILGTVDSVTDWITISANYQYYTPTASFTTSIAGVSNVDLGGGPDCSVSAAIYTRILPQICTLFNAVNNPSGIISGQRIQFGVKRTSGKYSPLGYLPLVKLCSAVWHYGIPYGYTAGDGSWRLENMLMLDLINA